MIGCYQFKVDKRSVLFFNVIESLPYIPVYCVVQSVQTTYTNNWQWLSFQLGRKIKLLQVRFRHFPTLYCYSGTLYC
jgi:hypothetical protein